MDLSQIVAMKAKKKLKDLTSTIYSSTQNILASSGGTSYASLAARLTALEQNVPATVFQLNQMAASNAVVLNETMLMLTTVSNFNRNKTEFTKMLYDGLADASGFDLVNSTNETYNSTTKQMTVTANGELILQTIACGSSVSGVVISLGVLSGSFLIDVKRNASDSWMRAAENEWISLMGQSAGTNLYIKFSTNETSVLNAYSICWA